MGNTLGKLVTRVIVVAVAILAAYAGWKWGYKIFPRVEEKLGIGNAEAARSRATEDAAARATAKIEGFRDSEEPELRLEASEVSSLLRSTPGILPGGVLDPSVSFAEDRIAVSARVLPADIPDLPGLGGIVGLLPDTVDVRVVGSLLPSGEQGTLVLVEGIDLRGWPVPQGSIPEILAALGRVPPPGAPASAVLVPGLGDSREPTSKMANSFWSACSRVTAAESE